RRLHDTAMAVIRKINAAPPNGGGGGGGRVVVRAVSLQVNSEDGSDPVLGGVIYRDRGKSSPKIAEQALSGDEGPGDDIGLVLIDPLDKSSPKIAHEMFKAGESLAQENLVIFLDDEAADGDHSRAVAVTGPVQKVLSALGIGSEHWPEPALQGEEVGPIFLVIEEEETNLTLDFSWDFPQDYDAMRNRLEHGPGLSDGDHLVITGTLVDGVWTNGSASTIGNGIIIRPEMVERTGVDGDPPTGSLEWLDAFLKDIFASSFAGQAGGEITGVIAPQGDVGLGGPIGLAGNDPLFQMIMIRPEMVARAVRGGITRIDHRGRSGTGSSH
ncbi:MAG: hypothetical protein MK194_17360, partial [Roseibacillus sp.]|nr:hypothetical protein [Roseibacillus sp.]